MTSDKMLVFQPRRPDLTREQFSQHWRTVHAEHARRITALQKYVQSHRVSATDRHFPRCGIGSSVYDGVSEAWFKDAAALASMTTSAEYRDGALVDEPNFLDIPHKVRLLCEERIAHAEPGFEEAALMKVILPLGAERKEIVQEFLVGDQVGFEGEVLGLEGIARYSVCEVKKMSAEQGASPIHFVVELGWRTPDDLHLNLETLGMSRVLETISANGLTSAALVAQEFRFI